MPNIIIKEADYTGESAQVDLTNAVYIPGFSINDPVMSVDGKEVDKYKLGEPTLYTNTDDFVSAIGDRPFNFNVDSTIGGYSSNEIYDKYEVVTYGGKYYSAKVDNAGWEKKTSIIPWGFSAGVFSKYTVVKHNGSVSYNISGMNTSEAPGVDTTNWSSPISSDSVPTYVSGTYNEGDIVIGSGSDFYYVSKVDNNTAALTDESSWAKTELGVYWVAPADRYTIVSYNGSLFVKKSENSVKETAPTSNTLDWKEEEVKNYGDDCSLYSIVYRGDSYYVKNAIQTIPSTVSEYWHTNDVENWEPYNSESHTGTEYSEFDLVKYLGRIYVNTTGVNTDVAPNQDADNWKADNTVTPGAGRYDAYDVDFDIDKAYVYAKTLLSLGLPVYYEVVDSGAGFKCTNVNELYARFADQATVENIFAKLFDKGSYSIKYVTTGGYPIYKDGTTNFISNAITPVAERADAVALIDHIQGLSADPSASNNPYYTLNNLGAEDTTFVVNPSWAPAHSDLDGGSYAAMLTPWADYTLDDAFTVGENSVRTIEMPASFYYLVCLAKSIKNNPDWLAIAGVTRGLDSIIDQKGEKPIVTNKMADAYMTEGGEGETNGRSINGITNIRPYGLTIWGNRTLLNNTNKKTTQSLAYLNTRCMVCDVKKTVFAAAQRFMFEQNNDVLWINFKSAITPLLDRLSTTGGISGYKIIKQKSKTTAKLCATIILYPIYAVEEIEVNIELRNEDVTIA